MVRPFQISAHMGQGEGMVPRLYVRSQKSLSASHIHKQLTLINAK